MLQIFSHKDEILQNFYPSHKITIKEFKDSTWQIYFP